MKDYEKAIEEAGAAFIIKEHLDGNSDTYYSETFIAGAKSEAAKEFHQQGMYTEKDLQTAFDSAREFDSLDGTVDIHIILPMGGDTSDLSPLCPTFEDWLIERNVHE